MLKTFITSIFLALLLTVAFSCKEKVIKEEVKVEQTSPVLDLEEIKNRGEIIALVDYSSTSYFMYKGTPMGFEYEILSKFAKSMDLKLIVKPVSDLTSIIDSLNNMKGDIIASNLTTTKERREKVEFTLPLIRTKQVLVQRKNKNNDKYISHLDELIGKNVYVQKGSSFYKRIQNLSEEIGGDIVINQVSGNITVEELIEQVSEGEIDYTIADQHVAKINKVFYKNIDINTAISLEQQLAWAIRKNAPNLLIAANEWLKEFKKTVEYRVIYLKYYGNTSLYRTRVNSELFSSKSGQISPYDKIIKQHAKSIDWDWRLLTSLIYQESQFDHYAKSWVGAQGLMQIMPATAAEYGVDSLGTPEQNIEAGVKYLQWLDKQFQPKVADSEERIKFVLAAYNVGLGHVFDAIRLADKFYLNPQLWNNNVANMLLKKSNPKYYNDEVVHYGYCRGREPYRYVDEIMERYEHYMNITEIE